MVELAGWKINVKLFGLYNTSQDTDNDGLTNYAEYTYNRTSDYLPW